MLEQETTSDPPEYLVGFVLIKESDAVLRDVLSNPFKATHLFALFVNVKVGCFDENNSSFGAGIVCLVELPVLFLECHQESASYL